jgi:hypothetical protein
MKDAASDAPSGKKGMAVPKAKKGMQVKLKKNKKK